MLNSCSSRIWFVIELCEHIKINELQIANFELFSNVPRQFRVYASERYLATTANSNNWPNKYFLGVYEAANTRAIQSFFIKDTLLKAHNKDMTAETNSENESNGEIKQQQQQQLTSMSLYVKYIKFEMLSHYGQEHFCPLSLVRIFGTSIVDEDDHVTHGEELDIDAVTVETPMKVTTTTTATSETSESTSNKATAPITAPIDEKVKTKPKLFELTSLFLNNIISVFLRENFNIKNLFNNFKANADFTTSEALKNVNLIFLNSNIGKCEQFICNYQ